MIPDSFSHIEDLDTSNNQNTTAQGMKNSSANFETMSEMTQEVDIEKCK